MIISTISIAPKSGQREAVLELLHSVRTRLLGMAGCENCAVFEENSDEGRVLLMELWDSVDNLRCHIRSELFHRVLLAMELADREPEIRYYDVMDVKGIDLIEEVRIRKNLSEPFKHNRQLKEIEST